jgi:hypothetical protein
MGFVLGSGFVHLTLVGTDQAPVGCLFLSKFGQVVLNILQTTKRVEECSHCLPF